MHNFCGSFTAREVCVGMPCQITVRFLEQENVGMKTPYRTPADIEAGGFVSRTNGLTDEDRFQVAISWIGHQGKPRLMLERQIVERRGSKFLSVPWENTALSSKKKSRAVAGRAAFAKSKKKKFRKLVMNDGNCHILHALVRQLKATKEVRVVYDAAAKCGKSMNEEIPAAKLRSDLVQVLLCICKEPVALVADIAKCRWRWLSKTGGICDFCGGQIHRVGPEVFKFMSWAFGRKA